MDGQAKSWVELSRHCSLLAKTFDLAHKLNSMAQQAAAEREWASISKFYDNCKKQVASKKGFPTFQKDCRRVEYKTSGWKLSDDGKSIMFTHKCGIGRLNMKGRPEFLSTRPDQTGADGYYVPFYGSVDRSVEPAGKAVGLDVGLKEFYTDSAGAMVENPRFLRKSEKVLKRSQRRVSKKVKGSNDQRKARQILGKRHFKISRQRKGHALKLARCLVTLNDVVA